MSGNSFQSFRVILNLRFSCLPPRQKCFAYLFYSKTLFIIKMSNKISRKIESLLPNRSLNCGITAKNRVDLLKPFWIVIKEILSSFSCVKWIAVDNGYIVEHVIFCINSVNPMLDLTLCYHSMYLYILFLVNSFFVNVKENRKKNLLMKESTWLSRTKEKPPTIQNIKVHKRIEKLLNG